MLCTFVFTLYEEFEPDICFGKKSMGLLKPLCVAAIRVLRSVSCNRPQRINPVND